MQILIAGASGFIGRNLVKYLESEGHSCQVLSRDRQGGGIFFPFSFNEPPSYLIEGFDVIIHLCGENIAKGRWTTAKKSRIRYSRIETTRSLVAAIDQLQAPPKIFISASALGFYGDSGENWVTENSPQGKGFIAELCQDWERVARPRHCQWAHARFGMVLGQVGEGSALDKMALLTKCGLGATLGSGNQFISWIHILDACAGLLSIIEQQITGPVNICGPEPMRQQIFAKTLAKILHRPCLFTMSPKLLSCVIGEMAKEILLPSIRAKPQKLVEHGFSFHYPHLYEALQKILFPLKGR